MNIGQMEKCIANTISHGTSIRIIKNGNGIKSIAITELVTREQLQSMYETPAQRREAMLNQVKAEFNIQPKSVLSIYQKYAYQQKMRKYTLIKGRSLGMTTLIARQFGL